MKTQYRMAALRWAAVGMAAVALAGCSGSSGDPAPATSAPPTSAADNGDAGCAAATNDGQTKNIKMQQLATGVYESIQCDGPTSMSDQLQAAAKDPQVAADAKAAGAQFRVDSAAGGTVLAFTAGMSGCQIAVQDEVNAKMVTCVDL